MAEEIKQEEVVHRRGEGGLVVNADFDLLWDTLSVQTHSNEDQLMTDFILTKIDELEDELGVELDTTMDNYGNIYVVKGEPPDGSYYPCVVSHTDTVHRLVKHFVVMEHNGVFWGMDMFNVKMAGVGGDDKVGVYVCLEAIRHLDFVKVAFFRNEEIGCQGSRAANMKFFENLSLCLQADRRSYADFIEHSNGIKIFSEEFHQEVLPLLEKYQYKRCQGLGTDVGQLKHNGMDVCAANVSAGYYNPHSDGEFVVLEDVEICLNLILEICMQHSDTRWLWTPPKPEPAKWESQGQGYGYMGNRSWPSKGSQGNQGNSPGGGTGATLTTKTSPGASYIAGNGSVLIPLPAPNSATKQSGVEYDSDDDELFFGDFRKSEDSSDTDFSVYDSWDGTCGNCRADDIDCHEFGYYCRTCGSFFSYEGNLLSYERYPALRDLAALLETEREDKERFPNPIMVYP